jgi:GT2 family glycosyltransferase
MSGDPATTLALPRGTIDFEERYTAVQEAPTSVVVVTYQTPKREFERMLAGLEDQTDRNFETIVVDNGNEWSVEPVVAGSTVVDRYVALECNEGVTVARNLGADRATGQLLVFLDDDAIPDEEFVAAHRRAHGHFDIVAARGKVRPKTDSIYNRLATWYDLGDETFPFLLNIEGNTSVDAETFEAVGGFDDRLTGRAGHEGAELTHRLVKRGYERDQIIYYPDAVIYHDQATSLSNFVRKKAANERTAKLLERNHVEVHEFARSYETPEGGDSRLSGFPKVVDLGTDAIVRFVLWMPSV